MQKEQFLNEPACISYRQLSTRATPHIGKIMAGSQDDKQTKIFTHFIKTLFSIR